MKRIYWELLCSVLLIAAGIGLGWQIRGAELQTKPQKAEELRLLAELDQIATQTANLDLICSNRLAAARQLSEQRLFEAVNRADQLVAPGFEFSDPSPVPNLSEAMWRAASYASANGASPEIVQRAQRLHDWLELQQVRPAT